MLVSDILPPLIICYGYSSSHVAEGSHRPTKPIGRFAIVATSDIAVPDEAVACRPRVALAHSDVGLRVTVRLGRSVVRNPDERVADKHRVWLIQRRLNHK